VSHLFRYEAGKMAAVLTRMLGTEHFDTAEDLVQETLIEAMETWRFRGVPDNPSAWLYKVAHNKAIDWVRSRHRQAKLLSTEEQQIKSVLNLSTGNEQFFAEDEIQDSVLRLMFACCHPAIPTESRIALTLKTLGGLSVNEIAKAFLTSEETIAKRIYRAKEKIKQENIKLEAPGIFELPRRLNSVLQVLYLLFNEGYHSAHSDSVIREDLCEEAMRLAYLLVQNNSTNLPKVNALLSLMCLQASRFDARTGDLGEIILLQDQDRVKWNKPLIRKGLEFLERASIGNFISEYHVEASIASVHALATHFEDTSWNKLATLYEVLSEIKPSPIVSLNRAIAIGYSISPEHGIIELEKIKTLQDNSHYYAALGNFYFKTNNYTAATTCFKTAIAKTIHASEREMLEQKIIACQGSLPNGTDFPTAL